MLNDRKPNSRARSAARMKKAGESLEGATPPPEVGGGAGGVEGR